GARGPVGADDLLSIDLSPTRLPTPPCAKVLDAAERVQVRARVSAFNDEIAAAIADTERTRGVVIAPVDLFTGFDQLGASGVDLNADGTPDLTTRYLGGIFSLDGIHPTRTGNALIANTFIEAINARFGESIPHVDVARVAAPDPLAHSPSGPRRCTGVLGIPSAHVFAAEHWPPLTRAEATALNPFYTSRLPADAQLYTCDRLGADGRCTVYEERPLVCRGYPWYGQAPREMPLADPECGYAVDLPGRAG